MNSKKIKLYLALLLFVFSAEPILACTSKKIISKVGIEQTTLRNNVQTKRLPRILWDGMQTGFANLIYDNSACVKQIPLVLDGNRLDHNELNQPLVNQFYRQLRANAEEYIEELVEEVVVPGSMRGIEIIIYWDEVEQELIDDSLGRGGSNELELSYKIYDVMNYTETTQFIFVELPLKNRKEATERVSLDIYNKIKNLKESIDQVVGE
jgi:hypothetical protein